MAHETKCKYESWWHSKDSSELTFPYWLYSIVYNWKIWHCFHSNWSTWRRNRLEIKEGMLNNSKLIAFRELYKTRRYLDYRKCSKRLNLWFQGNYLNWNLRRWWEQLNWVFKSWKYFMVEHCACKFGLCHCNRCLYWKRNPLRNEFERSINEDG